MEIGLGVGFQNTIGPVFVRYSLLTIDYSFINKVQPQNKVLNGAGEIFRKGLSWKQAHGMNQALDNVCGEVADRFYDSEFPAAYLSIMPFHRATCERRAVQAHLKLMI